LSCEDVSEALLNHFHTSDKMVEDQQLYMMAG